MTKNYKLEYVYEEKQKTPLLHVHENRNNDVLMMLVEDFRNA
jgi:hypothetical protein